MFTTFFQAFFASLFNFIPDLENMDSFPIFEEDDSIEFESGVRMLEIMDELMDEWDFPQRGLDDRTLVKGDSREEKFPDACEELTIDKVQEMYGTRNVQNKKGKLSTFVVQVAFRQRASWQGHVICVESNEKKEFVSALSLIRIIDKQNGVG